MSFRKNVIEREKIRCSICESASFESIYENIFRIWINGKLYIWPSDQVICKRCGLIFTNPQPTDHVLNFYYSNLFYFGEMDASSRIAQLNHIKNICKNIKTVFDIGAHTGVFLNVAKKFGLDVYGLEPSKEAVKIAREKYRINLINAFLDEDFVKKHGSKYDLVILSHVLEHVKNPVHFLEISLDLVSPEKYLYIEVPDVKRPKWNNIADFFSLEHIHHYSEEDFINMRYIFNVEIVDISRAKEYNVLRVIYKKREDAVSKVTFEFVNDFENKKDIVKNYAENRQAFLEKIRHKIEQVLDKGSEIIIYGAGMHTSQLLQSGILNGYKIKFVVDSDKRKEGSLFEGFTVHSPSHLRDETTPVLISSHDSQEEISSYLTDDFPHIRQIKLYDKVSSVNKGIRHAE